jgi:diguanylate cyclase (GGDEF)-like protein
MNLYPLDEEIAAREAALAGRHERSLDEVVALAWGLRQRDSRRALELCDEVSRLADGPGIVESDRACALGRALLVRAEVAALMADYPSAERWLTEGLSLCEGLANPLLAGDAAMVEAVVAHAQAQRDRYLGAWERAIDLHGQSGDHLRRNLARAWIAFLTAHSDRATAAAEVAALRKEAAEPRHAALESLLCAADGVLAYADANPESSVAPHKASLYARECGLVRHAIVSSVNAGTAMQTLGDYEGAAQAYAWGVEEARKTGWPVLMGTPNMRLASLHRELDQLESSEQLFREALGALAPAPGGIFKAEAHAGLGHTLLRQGRFAEAVELLREATRLFEGENSIDGLTVNLTLLARAYARCGRGAEAEIALVRAGDLIERHKVARLRLEHAEAQAELYECNVVPPPPGMTPAQAALKHLEEALAAGHAITNWQPTARLLLRLGGAYAQVDDAKRAFGCAEQAFQTQHRENLRRATASAAVMRARSDLERERVALEHQRQLNAALEQASLTDALTGLRNRRFLQHQVEADIAQALRRYEAGALEPVEEADLVFFLVDLDHFKQVNDTHGHAAGDAVLVQMRERLSDVFRESDYLVRWGGEEFLIVARGVSRKDAAMLAERVRTSVASRPFAIDGSFPLARTCSLGFASFPFLTRHPAVTTWQEVVDIADAGLYLAKRHGRNGWVGLVAANPGDPLIYPKRIKDDALGLLRHGELSCETSLDAVAGLEGTARPVTQDKARG